MIVAAKEKSLTERKKFRTAILIAQGIIGKCPQIEPPVVHHFSEGSYAREIRMAAETVIVGKLHRHSHANVLSKGKVTVTSEYGTETFEAPRTWVSEPGIKRMVYVHEDCIWTTFHVTQSTDLEQIEKEIIAESYDDLLE